MLYNLIGVVNNEIGKLGKFYVYGYDQVAANTIDWY